MTPTISPDFKAFVAETLRMQAKHNPDRSEAARKLREARKLERQIKETADVH